MKVLTCFYSKQSRRRIILEKEVLSGMSSLCFCSFLLSLVSVNQSRFVVEIFYKVMEEGEKNPSSRVLESDKASSGIFIIVYHSHRHHRALLIS